MSDTKISLVVKLLAISVLSHGADVPPQLVQARSAFEKECEAALNPVRVRYVRVLEDVKRSLTAKGNLEGAVQAQREIDRVMGKTEYPGLVGSWTVTYDNRSVRHYSIAENGNVLWTDYSPPKRGVLTKQGQDFILDFSDGKLERLSPSGSGFRLEHFNPATKLRDGISGMPAKGEQSK